MKQFITTILEPYQQKINEELEEELIDSLSNTELQSIYHYILDGGKRVRPIIIEEICRIMNQSNTTFVSSSSIKIIIELLHSASLIIDDLPCMDDDAERRHKPTAHIKYGEIGAELISFTCLLQVPKYLTKLYDSLTELYTSEEASERVVRIYKNIIYNLGSNGAMMGQYLDLLPQIFSSEQSIQLESFYNQQSSTIDIIHKKTSSLFDISFVSAFIMSGGSYEQLPLIQEAAKLFGLAFQISDDFLDTHDDKERSSKDLSPNYVLNNGKLASFTYLKQIIVHFRNIMIDLQLWSYLFNGLCLFLLYRAEKTIEKK